MEWEMKYPCVYEILNTIDGRRYIGATKNFKLRKEAHLRDLGKNRNKNKNLQAAYNEHGECAFAFSILAYVEESIMLMVEARLIRKYDNAYNITKPNRTEAMDRIKEARLILCPEDKRLRHANMESFERMKKLYFPWYSVETIRKLESSSSYKPSVGLQRLINKFIERANRKLQSVNLLNRS